MQVNSYKYNPKNNRVLGKHHIINVKCTLTLFSRRIYLETVWTTHITALDVFDTLIWAISVLAYFILIADSISCAFIFIYKMNNLWGSSRILIINVQNPFPIVTTRLSYFTQDLTRLKSSLWNGKTEIHLGSPLWIFKWKAVKLKKEQQHKINSVPPKALKEQILKIWDCLFSKYYSHAGWVFSFLWVSG